MERRLADKVRNATKRLAARPSNATQTHQCTSRTLTWLNPNQIGAAWAPASAVTAKQIRILKGSCMIDSVDNEIEAAMDKLRFYI